jgi:hypothetical protein
VACGQNEDWYWIVQPRAVDKAAIPRVDAALAEFLVQKKTFAIRKDAYKKRLENLGHRVLFYPKFHCELNFIERYWCRAKWFARENCGYGAGHLVVLAPWHSWQKSKKSSRLLMLILNANIFYK